MSKQTCAQSRQTSAIHLVKEERSSRILHSGVTPGARLLLAEGLAGESSTAILRLKEAGRLNAGRDRATLTLVNPATVLRELYELLEDYAPVWYTEENHNRAVAALGQAIR